MSRVELPKTPLKLLLEKAGECTSKYYFVWVYGGFQFVQSGLSDQSVLLKMEHTSSQN